MDIKSLTGLALNNLYMTAIIFTFNQLLSSRPESWAIHSSFHLSLAYRLPPSASTTVAEKIEILTLLRRRALQYDRQAGS
jgi:hypothetical protein